MSNTKKHLALIIAFIMALTVVPGIVFADSASAATTLKKPTLTNYAASSTSIKNTWTKIKGAKGYQVYRATSSKGKYKKVKTVTKGKTATWTNKKLKKNKKYYYKVRAYKIVKGKKKYSKFSSAQWAKPTNSPNPVFSLSRTAKTTSRISVKITNKGRYSMVVDPIAMFLRDVAAFEAAMKIPEPAPGREIEYFEKMNAVGAYVAEATKAIKIKPGKTATINFTTLNAKAKAIKVSYSGKSFVNGGFTFNKKTYEFIASKTYGSEWN